jgi:VanZ family protein
MRLQFSERTGAIRYVWAILWMGLIFFFSTDFGSFPNTFRYLEPILRALFPHITTHTLLLVHQMIRKLAHAAEYAILSYFWFIALNRGLRIWSPRSAFWALALSVSYALLDEYHQTFVPSRTASLRDVGIDSLGAVLMQVYLLIALQQPLPESGNGKNAIG